MSVNPRDSAISPTDISVERSRWQALFILAELWYCPIAMPFSLRNRAARLL